jgi:hypothetical protein
VSRDANEHREFIRALADLTSSMRELADSNRELARQTMRRADSDEKMLAVATRQVDVGERVFPERMFPREPDAEVVELRAVADVDEGCDCGECHARATKHRDRDTSGDAST